MREYHEAWATPYEWVIEARILEEARDARKN